MVMVQLVHSQQEEVCTCVFFVFANLERQTQLCSLSFLLPDVTRADYASRSNS